MGLTEMPPVSITIPVLYDRHDPWETAAGLRGRKRPFSMGLTEIRLLHAAITVFLQPVWTLGTREAISIAIMTIPHLDILTAPWCQWTYCLELLLLLCGR